MKHNRDRIIELDKMRGMAIALVVVGHEIAHFINFSTTPHTPYFLGLIYYLIYSFHMPIFFFISGVLFKAGAQNRKNNFIKKKFKSLMVPCLIWVLIMTIFSKLSNGSYTLNDLWTFLYKPSIFQYWFFYILFFIEVFCYLLFNTFELQNTRMMLISSFILLLFGTYLPDIWIVRRFSGYLFYFVFGIYFYEVRNQFSEHESTWGFRVLTCLFVVANAATSIIEQGNILDGLALNMLLAIVSISGIVVTYYFCRKINTTKISKLLIGGVHTRYRFIAYTPLY